MSEFPAWLNEQLSALKGAGRYRHLESSATAQGTEVVIDERAYLNFCSNDYLGLAGDPEIRAAMCEGIARYGVGSGASALLSGRSTAHRELEERLCTYLKRDRALLFSSGYLANLGAVGALVRRHDLVCQDRLNHASTIDAVRLSGAETHRYSHCDAVAVSECLENTAYPQKWVITDSVFSMDGDIAPLGALATACQRGEALLMVDDAHGLGVIGNGCGCVGEFNLDQGLLPVLVVTFGKALGTAGAAVLGPELVIEMLIQRARTFVFDTAPPPALAFATTRALDLSVAQPERRVRLFENVRYFREAACAAGFPVCPHATPIQPLIIGDDAAAVAAAQRLASRGIYVRAVRPPTVPSGTARLRVTLTAAHERAQIDALVAALCDALEPVST